MIELQEIFLFVSYLLLKPTLISIEHVYVVWHLIQQLKLINMYNIHVKFIDAHLFESYELVNQFLLFCM